MPDGNIDYYAKPNPLYTRAVRAWTTYYKARGVACGRDADLARRKCRKSFQMPPA